MSYTENFYARDFYYVSKQTNIYYVNKQQYCKTSQDWDHASNSSDLIKCYKLFDIVFYV